MKSRCRAVGSGALLGRRAAQAFASRISLPDSSRFAGRPPAVPLGRALKVAGVLAQPIEVGVESSDQSGEAGAEARARYLGLRMEKDVVEVPQPRWRARALQRSADDGKDALAESCRLLHLPGADFGARRGRREHENHRVGLADQVAETSFPVLATGDAVTVDEALKAASVERRISWSAKSRSSRL